MNKKILVHTLVIISLFSITSLYSVNTDNEYVILMDRLVKKMISIERQIAFCKETNKSKESITLMGLQKNNYTVFCYLYTRIKPVNSKEIEFSINPYGIPGFFVIDKNTCTVFNHVSKSSNKESYPANLIEKTVQSHSNTCKHSRDANCNLYSYIDKKTKKVIYQCMDKIISIKREELDSVLDDVMNSESEDNEDSELSKTISFDSQISDNEE